MRKLTVTVAGIVMLMAGAASAQIYQRWRFADPVDYDALVSIRDFKARIIDYAKDGRCDYAKQLAGELGDSAISEQLRPVCDGPPVRLWD